MKQKIKLEHIVNPKFTKLLDEMLELLKEYDKTN